MAKVIGIGCDFHFDDPEKQGLAFGLAEMRMLVEALRRDLKQPDLQAAEETIRFMSKVLPGSRFYLREEEPPSPSHQN